MFIRMRGFTIVELLIVIVIISILALIATVTYSGISQHAQTSSLRTDVSAMDKAQKIYMALTDSAPLSYGPDGSVNDLLVFKENKGNSIIVKLKNAHDYCVYGYNPSSSYPDTAHPLIRSSDSTACGPLEEIETDASNAIYSTVAIIGQRLEAFKAAHGFYPHLKELTDIGLVIKPNSDHAAQQQLYCRNNTKAFYLQIDQQNNVVYTYDTATHSVGQPTDLDKLSLEDICPHYDISSSTSGYESTGIKTPDI